VLDAVANKVVPNVDVLGAQVELGVVGEVDRALVVLEEREWSVDLGDAQVVDNVLEASQ
jgi:hypothetical protein